MKYFNLFFVIGCVCFSSCKSKTPDSLSIENQEFNEALAYFSKKITLVYPIQHYWNNSINRGYNKKDSLSRYSTIFVNQMTPEKLDILLSQNNKNIKGFAIKFYITKYCNKVDYIALLLKKTQNDTLQLLTTNGHIKREVPLNFFVLKQLYDNVNEEYPRCFPYVDTLWYKYTHPPKLKPSKWVLER